MTPFQTGDGLFGRVTWRYDWALEYFHQAIILRTSGEQDTVSIVRSLQTGRFEDTMNTKSEGFVDVDLHRIAKVDHRVTWLRLYPSPILLFDREALNWEFWDPVFASHQSMRREWQRSEHLCEVGILQDVLVHLLDRQRIEGCE